MPTATPPVATSTVTKAVHTVTKHVVTKAAAKGGLPPISFTPNAGLIYIGIGAAAFAAVMIIMMLLMLRRGSKAKYVPKYVLESLGMGFSPVDSDMIGVVRYLDTGKLVFVPLKRIGPTGMKISVDPGNPLIVLPHPNPTTFSLAGRPVIDVIAVGGIGYEANMVDLAMLGIGELATESPEWHDTSNPSQAIADLIRKLATKQSEVTTTIPITPDMKVGIAVKIPPVVSALMRTRMAVSNAVLYSTYDEILSHEQIGKIIEKASVMREQARASSMMKIFGGVSILIFIIFLGYILWGMLVAKK